jgi:hypothetical protein
MANTQALCSAFKLDLLNGWHAFSSSCPARTISTADTYQAALYLASATVDATTASYSATGEVSNSGSYTAGGPTVTWISPAKTTGTGANGSSTTYTTLSASITVTSFTATAFDAVLIYNATNNKAVSVHTFGSQSITAGTFTLTMPTNDQTTGLVRLT